ncbi:hypothetical protein EDB83DRAFT_2326127 [Lactarius deliciosus]|nr:hypothetical protein EDB83DRAFT_2326127 [Lactarius deliciosus]
MTGGDNLDPQADWAIHNLFQSLLCAEGANDRSINYPTDQAIFLWAFLSKNRYRISNSPFFNNVIPTPPNTGSKTDNNREASTEEGAQFDNIETDAVLAQIARQLDGLQNSNGETEFNTSATPSFEVDKGPGTSERNLYDTQGHPLAGFTIYFIMLENPHILWAHPLSLTSSQIARQYSTAMIMLPEGLNPLGLLTQSIKDDLSPNPPHLQDKNRAWMGKNANKFKNLMLSPHEKHHQLTSQGKIQQD